MSIICEKDGVVKLEKPIFVDGWNKLYKIEYNKSCILYIRYLLYDDMFAVSYDNHYNNITYHHDRLDRRSEYIYFNSNNKLKLMFKTLIDKYKIARKMNRHDVSEIVFIIDNIRKYMNTIIDEFNRCIEDLNNRDISFGSSVKRAN